jgi:hypothetical protein
VDVGSPEAQTLSEYVIARFDEAADEWRDLGRVRADDRIDALDRWALEQGGFDSLEPGVYGSRHEEQDGPWYRRLRPAYDAESPKVERPHLRWGAALPGAASRPGRRFRME